MEYVKSALSENGIEIIITDIDSKGFYLPEYKTIFVNQNLSEMEQRKVILHEARHALNHNELTTLYQQAVFHSKMEYEANKFMIRKLLKEYVQNSFAHLSEFNYMTFMQIYGIDLYYEEYVKQLIVHYVTTGEYLRVVGRKINQ
ncbi:ImmA/IrrE family metallo-endopeptidase [Enterococcus hirae]